MSSHGYSSQVAAKDDYDDGDDDERALRVVGGLTGWQSLVDYLCISSRLMAPVSSQR